VCVHRVARVSDVVTNPTLTAPITGGTRGGAFGALSAEALATAGYIEQEYFFEGVATEYAKAGTWNVDGYRRWETAGLAHAETPQWVVHVRPVLDFGPGCAVAVNAAPHHAVVKAALRALSRWVIDGTRRRQSPEIELADPLAVPAAIVRDQFGNALGGIRLPELEAPTAILDGRINSPATPPSPGTQNFCSLFGGTVPFDADRLAQLYRNHQDFVGRFREAADRLVDQGFWLRPEAQDARRAARESNIGK
jgi:hypothetical protein